MNSIPSPPHDQADGANGVVINTRDETDLKPNVCLLCDREVQLQTITDAMPGMVVKIDAQYRYIFVNKTCEEWLGLKADSILGMHMREVLDEADYEEIKPYYEEAFAGKRVAYEREQGGSDGIKRWMQVNLVPEVDKEGKVQGICLLASDITHRKDMEQALRESKAGFRSIVEKNSTGILVLDLNGNCLFRNSAAQIMLADYLDPEESLFDTLGFFRTDKSELKIRRSDGSCGVVELQITDTVWEGKATKLVMLYDVTARKENERQIKHMAYHDALTGLPNRLLVHERIEQALARAYQCNTLVGLLYLDLDRFKAVNDSLGHAAGDKLLRGAAQRLKMFARNEDAVARLSSDEFIVLLEDVNNSNQVQDVADQIVQSLRMPYWIHNSEVVVDVSIGISIYPMDGELAETLMKHADTAMYHAKRSGRRKVQLFEAEMGERLAKYAQMENELRRAIKCNEFQLYYQPQINVATRRMEGAEALLRWLHPQRGLISPAEFIPVLEESGLINPVGDWVLREACRQARAWIDLGLPPLTMAVNLSGLQFYHGNLDEYVKKILNETQLEPQFLELEITETILMESRSDMQSVLRKLKQYGVRVAVDDFGTGYSSLSYLKQFDIDRLKIDRSFISDLPYDKNDVAIVKAVLAMAKALDLKVTAEGVENEGQARFLQEHNCDSFQGYLFNPPIVSERFELLYKIHNDG